MILELKAGEPVSEAFCKAFFAAGYCVGRGMLTEEQKVSEKYVFTRNTTQNRKCRRL